MLHVAVAVRNDTSGATIRTDLAIYLGPVKKGGEICVAPSRRHNNRGIPTGEVVRTGGNHVYTAPEDGILAVLCADRTSKGNGRPSFPTFIALTAIPYLQHLTNRERRSPDVYIDIPLDESPMRIGLNDQQTGGRR